MKVCNTCGKEKLCSTDKLISEFHKDCTKKDGYRNYCKVCAAEKEKNRSSTCVNGIKICTGKYCEIKEQPITNFNKNKRRKDGYVDHCNVCRKEERKVEYEKYTDRINARNKRYYDNNKDKLNEQSKKYRLEHIEHITKTSKERYRNNRDEVIAKQKEYATKNRDKISTRDKLRHRQDPIPKMHGGTVARARNNNLPHNITRQDLYEELEKCSIGNGKYRCPRCKNEMVVGTKRPPSCDRFDPPKGYVKGNVRIICNKCNTRKNDSTREERVISAMDYFEEATPEEKLAIIQKLQQQVHSL